MIGSNLGERMCGVALMPAFEGEADTHGWSGGGPGRSGAEGRRSAEDRPKRGRNLRSSNLHNELAVPRLDVAQSAL
jgi:hypothetical protein